MSWQLFWVYLTTVFLVSATPGPNMLLVMTTSIRHGMRSALITMAGCMTALVILMGISAGGLSAILAASEHLFTILRWIGAAYLIYLGVKCWRAPADPAQFRASDGTSLQARPLALFRQGFLIASSNPKAILFFGALFPQFIDLSAPKAMQLLVLGTTFVLVEFSWQLVYAVGGIRISPWLGKPRTVRWFNRTSGGVFVGFGALMASVHR